MAWEIDERSGTTLLTDVQIKEPENCKVIFLNDDYTTKEFVVSVLETIFHKNTAEAEFLTEKVHRTGSAVIGVYPYDIAATRVELTTQNARANGFPLRCTLEKA